MDAKRLNEIEEWYGPGSVSAQLCAALRSLQAEHEATVAALEQAKRERDRLRAEATAARNKIADSRDEARAARDRLREALRGLDRVGLRRPGHPAAPCFCVGEDMPELEPDGSYRHEAACGAARAALKEV